jgi:hypothetical protein
VPAADHGSAVIRELNAMLARQIVVGIGIALIFPLMIYYGVSTFHPAPKWNDYVTNEPALPATATAEERKQRAEQNRIQGERFRAAAKSFARSVVMVAAPLGLIAIVVGSLIGMHAIGTGLIAGGILAVGWGYYGYWSYLDDWIRFVSLLCGFAVLLFVAWRMVPLRPKPAGEA